MLLPARFGVSRDGSSAEWKKASTHDLLPWDHGRVSSCTGGRERAGKGVGVMYLDWPCPITTNDITSFNLYNTGIDPSGCYRAVIAAQVWAQLSFGGGEGSL